MPEKTGSKSSGKQEMSENQKSSEKQVYQVQKTPDCPTPDPASKAHLLAWEQEYSHLQWGGPNSVRAVEAYLPEGSKVLDAGSGNGRYLAELSGHYLSVGTDVSRTALLSSRKYLEKKKRAAEHVVSSIHALPFRAETFDAVLCYGVLQHLFGAEREKAVKEFKRVLKGNGLVFFEAFGTEDMRYGGETSTPAEAHTFQRKNGIIYHYFSKEELIALFEGFEVLEIKDVKREKLFKGENYLRHQIRAVFRVT